MATLDTGQLMSHTRTTILDTIAFLKGFDGSIIPVSEVHKLLTKINDILNKAVCK